MSAFTIISTTLYAQLQNDAAASVAKLLYRPFRRKKTYIERLRQLIHQTVVEFEQTHPKKEGTQLPFYHSEVIFTKLTMYILDKANSIQEIDYEYDLNRNFYQPTDEETKLFFIIFFRKASSDKLLKLLHRSEQHVNEVFRISRKLDSMDLKIDQLLKRTPSELANVLFRNLGYSSTLMKNNKPQEALDFLLDYKSNNWENFNDESKCQILNDIGLCYLELDQENKGATNLLEASKYQNNASKALGLAALAYALLKNEEEVIKIFNASKTQQDTHEYVYASRIMIDEGQTELSEVLTDIPVSAHSLPQVAFCISRHERTRGNTESSINWLETAFLNNNKKGSSIAGILGCSIIDMVTNQNQELTNVLNEKVQRGIDLISGAWEAIPTLELKKRRYYWLMMRGIGKKLIDDISGAYLDLKETINLERNEYTLHNFALCAFAQGRFEETISILEELVGNFVHFDKNEDVRLMLADLYSTSNKLKDAIALAVDVLENATTQKVIQDSASLLVDFYLQQNDTEAAMALCGTLNDHNQKAFHFLNLAKISNHLNRTDECLRNLEMAVSLSESDNDPFMLKTIGSRCYKFGYFKGAIKVFERFVKLDSLNRETRLLIDSYLREKRYNEILSIAQSFRSNGVLDAGLIEREIFIYSSFADDHKALNICEEYRNIDNGNIAINVSAAMLYHRLGDNDSAARILNEINDLSELTVRNGFQTAVLFTQVGFEEKGLNFLYELRRQHFNNADAHVLYVTSYLNSGPQEKINLDSVSSNSAVTLLCQNIATTYIIEDRTTVNSSEGELSPQSTLAKRLLGKKVGDEIEINDRFGSTTGKIVEILNKRVYAHRRSTELLQTVFASEADLKVLSLKGESDEDRAKHMKTQILEQIAQAEEQSSQLIENYKRGILAIGGVAKIRNQNPVETWKTMIGHPDLGVFNGIVGDFEATRQTVLSGPPLVLDLITVLTIDAVEICSFYESLTNRIIVGSLTIKALQAYAAYLNFGNGDRAFFSRQDDQLVHYEITQEETKREVDRITAVIGWVQSNCDVISSDTIYSLDSEYREQLQLYIGKAFLESLLLANESSGLLISEEVAIRLVAIQEFKIQSVTSQQLIRIVIDNGTASRKLFDKTSLKLIQMNYRGVLVDSIFLLYLLQESNGQMSDEFVSAISILKGSQSGENAIMVGCEFIKTLYDSKIDLVVLTSLVNEVLEVMFAERQSQTVLDRILNSIPQLFKGMNDEETHFRILLFNFVSNVILTDEDTN